MTPEPMLVRIAEAAALDDQDDARDELAEIWDELGPSGDPLHRCALAHAMADLHDDDPHEELTWDLRALDAADLITDERARQAGMVATVLSFQPSLHLNIAEAYRKLGEPWDARDHLDLGLAAVDALPDDGYGRMIRAGLERLGERLDAGDIGEV
jgi:hypothetical protein